MKKVFLFAVALAGLSAAIYALRPPHVEQETSATIAAGNGTIQRHSPISQSSTPSIATKTTAQNNEERYQAISDNSLITSLEERITELQELYPYRDFSREEVLDLLAEPNAWQSTFDAPEDLPITDTQRHDGRAFIELNPERFHVLLPGDTIDLPLEKLGMHLQMQVDSREPLPNGGFTLHGHILDSDELMRATITQGPGLSLAGIDTPQGHVVMQANDTHGWIASSETLFKQNPHTTDALLPTDE